MVRERAFVTDMDFCSHSMLQQTLSPSPFHLYFHPSPTSVPPPSAAAFPHHPRPQTAALQAPYFRSTQVEREEGRKMETAALKNGFRPEAAAAPPPLTDEVVWAVERGNSFVDDFVDDLLNLQGLEPEEEEEEERYGDGDGDGDETLDGAFELETSNSSAASVDHPPVSDISLLPAHDEAELEWVSRIIDDTMAEFPPCAQTTAAAVTVSQPLPPAPAGNRKVRSKRARVTGRAWPAAPFATDSSATVTAGDSSSSSCTSPSSYSSCLIYTHSAFRPASPLLPVARPKKRGRKPKHPFAGGGGAGDRRCTHCGTQKTPQWRAGPEGSKTLCNACGVRFKSGRLLPEYRPACSPTFVSHVHSNSHRKVLEMRRNKTDPVPTF